MDRIHPPAPAAITRQARHALTVLARLTPGRRTIVQHAATEYLSQVDGHVLPMGYDWPLHNAAANRADAYRMRFGATLTGVLGISCQPGDADLPDTARAVLTAINAPVDQLTTHARTTGQPAAIVFLHIAGALR